MSDSQVTLRTRKFIRNPLLGRKQMVVYVKSPQHFHRHLCASSHKAPVKQHQNQEDSR